MTRQPAQGFQFFVPNRPVIAQRINDGIADVPVQLLALEHAKGTESAELRQKCCGISVKG